MTMSATTWRVGKLRHRSDVDARHVIVTDEPFRLGRTDEGPVPHELLPAALRSCIATMIAMYAECHSWDTAMRGSRWNTTRTPTPRRVELQIQLPDSLSDDQVNRLERVPKTCPLRRSLEASFEFEERIVPSPISASA